MEKKHIGSCLCALVKFEIDGDFESFYLCHCKYCQKDTGSAHASNLVSRTAKLHWLSGRDFIKTYNLPSTRHTKSFCQECSSALPSLQMEGKLLIVPAGSLDSEITIQPTAHIFNSSRACWDENFESIIKYEKFPI